MPREGEHRVIDVIAGVLACVWLMGSASAWLNQQRGKVVLPNGHPPVAGSGSLCNAALDAAAREAGGWRAVSHAAVTSADAALEAAIGVAASRALDIALKLIIVVLVLREGRRLLRRRDDTPVRVDGVLREGDAGAPESFNTASICVVLA